MSDSDTKNSNVTVRPQKKMCAEPPEVHKTIPKVPPFSADEPELWFALLETQFHQHGIVDDQVKYNNVISHIDITYAKTVKDIILNPPATNRYVKIKTELIKRLTASHEEKVKQLLSHEVLGDRKPSQFLRHLQDLAGPSVPPDLVRSIWSTRLPNHIQSILAAQPTHTLEQLADLADRINEINSSSSVASTSTPSGSTTSSSEITTLRNMVEQLSMKLDQLTRPSRRQHSQPRRRRSTSRSRSRPTADYRKDPVCWYHRKYGTNARMCVTPCDYKAGNATGNL